MTLKKVNCKYENQITDEDYKKYQIVSALIDARKRSNLSQTDIANKSGLTQQMVSRVETLFYTPTLNTILRYADAVGLKIVLVDK